MLPMWELLQMKEVLSAYRILLKDDTTTDDAIREHTRQIMECTAMLISEAENEIKRQTNEKKNSNNAIRSVTVQLFHICTDIEGARI